MDARDDEGEDGVSAYRTIRVTTPDSPVAELADVEAWKARKKYPSMLFAGGPVFGVARERESGGWELHPHCAGLAPQDARDGLGAHFRQLAQAAAEEGDDEARTVYLAAGERLDWEPLDELTVRGERYRVVRAERFVRMGPDGPEPPRATDPDPGRSDAARTGYDPAGGLVVDPLDPSAPARTGRVSEGVLRAELLTALRKNGRVPSDVRHDSRKAARTHPGGVLLPATFMTAEREGGRWQPDPAGTAATPQAARDGLAMHLRVMVPWQTDLDADEREVYLRAADRIDTEHCDELHVAGRHFRVVRVERLLRIGPDGPEGPRPSDPDPIPPVMVHEQQIGEQGVPVDEEEDEEPDERMERFMELFDEGRRRRAALQRGRP